MSFPRGRRNGYFGLYILFLLTVAVDGFYPRLALLIDLDNDRKSHCQGRPTRATLRTSFPSRPKRVCRCHFYFLGQCAAAACPDTTSRSCLPLSHRYTIILACKKIYPRLCSVNCR